MPYHHGNHNMVLNYDQEQLREIGQRAKSKANYHLFSLKYEIRMKIINLDIRKKVRQYRRSWAGRKLFHKIAIVSTKLGLHRPNIRTVVQENNINILLIPNRHCRKTIDYKCATINCCSIVNKTAGFKVELIEHNLNVCALTEYWIKEGDNTTAIQLCPDGYSSMSIPRIGGGIAIVHKSDITLKSKTIYNCQTMECAGFLPDLENVLINLCVIYRPPNTSIVAFCEDLTDHQERNVTSPGRMNLVGDINIPTNQKQHPDTVLLEETLDGLNLRNQVDFATHRLENTLDAVITTQEDPMLNRVAQGDLFSDHYCIFFNITRSISTYQVKEVAYRKTKLISPDTFACDISWVIGSVHLDHLNLKSSLALYNSTLTQVLDQHAALKRKFVPNHRQVPWFSESIRDEIRKNRQLEWIWRQDKTNPDKYHYFYFQCRLVSNVLFSSEKKYYLNIFHEHRRNIKQVFKVCDSLLGKGKDPPLPPGFMNQELADNFNDFFITKITNIRSKLIEQNLGSSDILTKHCTIPRTLEDYWLLSCDDVARIVLASPTKTCEADPIPTELLKKVLPSIMQLVTKLVNETLQTGEFPDDLQEALVKSLLKKITLEPINKNYRPVSNLPFMGKLMERCVIDQLMDHIHTNNLMEHLQSA